MAAIWIMPVLFVSEVFMWITNIAVNNTASNARKVICPRAKDVFSVWNTVVPHSSDHTFCQAKMVFRVRGSLD